MSVIEVGQRWRYQAAGLDFIMEVQEERRATFGGSCKGLVLQGNYFSGTIQDFCPFPHDTTGDSCWSYLAGQDKPNE